VSSSPSEKVEGEGSKGGKRTNRRGGCGEGRKQRGGRVGRRFVKGQFRPSPLEGRPEKGGDQCCRGRRVAKLHWSEKDRQERAGERRGAPTLEE